MSTLRSALICIALASVASLFTAGTVFLIEAKQTIAAWGALPQILNVQASELRSESLALAGAGTAAALREVHEFSEATSSQVSVAIVQADLRLADAIARTDAQLNAANGQLIRTNTILDRRVGEITASVIPLVDHASHIADRVDGILLPLSQCNDDIENPCLSEHVQATLGAMEIAAQASARVAADVSDAVPAFVKSTQAIAENSNRTSEATTQVMRNMADATKPLPKWLSLALKIAPLSVPPLVGFATVVK